MNFTASNGATIASKATTDTDGKVSVPLTNTKAGSSEVTATINGASQKVTTTFAIVGWIQLTPNAMTWADADAHCKANGARLPTNEELQALWEQNTVGRPYKCVRCMAGRSPASAGAVPTTTGPVRRAERASTTSST